MKYAIVDHSNQKSAIELTAYAAAQTVQLNHHYASCYDGDGDADDVRVTDAAAPLADDEAPIHLWGAAPASAPEGALAVHGVGANGLPVCDVYLDLLEQAGQADEWQAAASHEVLESRADARLHACVELDNGEIWDRECCDRVEAESYPIGVTIDGTPITVRLSNFNTPECFEPCNAPGEFYDWMRLSPTPNLVKAGGYAQQFTLDQGWTQVGSMRGYRAELARRGLSRGARRKARETKRA